MLWFPALRLHPGSLPGGVGSGPPSSLPLCPWLGGAAKGGAAPRWLTPAAPPLVRASGPYESPPRAPHTFPRENAAEDSAYEPGGLRLFLNLPAPELGLPAPGPRQ